MEKKQRSFVPAGKLSEIEEFGSADIGSIKSETKVTLKNMWIISTTIL
jgi:hypothetical protein